MSEIERSMMRFLEACETFGRAINGEPREQTDCYCGFCFVRVDGPVHHLHEIFATREPQSALASAASLATSTLQDV